MSVYLMKAERGERERHGWAHVLEERRESGALTCHTVGECSLNTEEAPQLLQQTPLVLASG